MEIKLANKIRLSKYIRDTTGIAVDPHALFDIQVKRIHEVLPAFLDLRIPLTLAVQTSTNEHLWNDLPVAQTQGNDT
jgi:glucan phosphorylase